MQDQGDSKGDRGGPRDGRSDDRPREDRQRREGGGPPGSRGGADTRFLQLEMSQVLYTEAADVARPAFRELLLEAAKERMRERFGEEITALAQLAVDELLNEVQASFEVEARIQQYQEDRRPPSEKLRAVFAGRSVGAEPRPAQGQERRGRAARRGKRKR
jgi:hypothetical protein